MYWDKLLVFFIFHYLLFHYGLMYYYFHGIAKDSGLYGRIFHMRFYVSGLNRFNFQDFFFPELTNP
ncbi:hypothetical protein LEP1GSC016_1789 [Leptospira borgpetersenii serovar Hardjo-bovis str. Sponselee]|uniref:Uncharacterized protein n=1 Tax=Leptospira borgpetersenii serovar Hardjo-bovis str. Sponselee TaxID=1303729 RepID=M6BUI7_LEPBO|nr:hypothetical protein LBK6_07860 [Leptospira borgpetersenii serovar Hardjo]AWV70108.1 hypothetical protein B9T54_08600 [Leptospira borgpetersenii serovar Hardjo-bovis]EMJ77470.1 hypothetical protein LEP1GSC016_1789 [Leptospira borgpetersenii serovar Hardjo-bovis str. Sponselee]TQE50770.1 hypothetical protein FFZ95_17365 [Leptospira borgpetersenii]AMX61507.1 hypothetical protein LBK9_07890 [Leptospira borgpetersenii serovar Hardjo]